MRKECLRTTDFGHRFHKEGGFRAQTAHGGLILGMDCVGRADFAHGLHMEGFVYENVLCVVIVLVIIVVLCVCVRHVLCFVSIGFYEFHCCWCGKVLLLRSGLHSDR